MHDYSGLEQLLRDNKLKKSDLIKILNISSRTIAKISKGEKIAPSVIEKLCAFFGCAPINLYRIAEKNQLLQQLKEEKDHKISGGFYHELQIRMTYNSNHIEGSALSEDQTRRIFETNTIGGEDALPVDDVFETVNHFRAIDYCIDTADEVLSENIIKHLHFLLKNSTRDQALPWFNVGDYKIRPNVVGGEETSAPANVVKDMQALLSAYNQKTEITFEDIVEFHFKFEKIHPFQDGNGRVGRLIAFKECLKHNIVPFIIEDRKKHFYYRGLKEFETEPGFLIETCYDGQDTIKALLRMFDLSS